MKTSNKVILIIIAIIVVVALIPVINAEKYKMVVNVVEGENVMGVNPLADKLDFGDLSRNNGMTRYVNLQIGGKIPVYFVVWKYGGLAELVRVEKNYFTLQPGDELKLGFAVNIPPSAPIKKYSGGVWIFRFPKVF